MPYHQLFLIFHQSPASATVMAQSFVDGSKRELVQPARGRQSHQTSPRHRV
jgi:hypothetical protein